MKINFKDTTEYENLLATVCNIVESTVKTHWQMHKKPARAFLISRKVSRKLVKLQTNTEGIAVILEKQRRIKLVTLECMANFLMPFHDWERLTEKEKFLMTEDLNASRTKEKEVKEIKPKVNSSITKKYFTKGRK